MMRGTWQLRTPLVLLAALAPLGWVATGRPQAQPAGGRSSPAVAATADEFDSLLERLRREAPGEYEKVLQLPRATALEFLRARYGQKAPPGAPAKGAPAKGAPPAGKSPLLKTPAAAAPGTPLPRRLERFEKIETLALGEFRIDLCRRADGAFGLGEVRRGDLLLRRADFLVTWQVQGRWSRFDRREGRTVFLREPAATLAFSPEERACAGTTFHGFRLEFNAAASPVVETSSWELGGSTRGLSYFDGYRGWHAPPGWQRAEAVPETNPKLCPSLLQGTGFQFESGEPGALVHFHTTPGDRLRSASRGEALEFETTFTGAGPVDRHILIAAGDSRINLWSRARETVLEEIRRALDLPAPRPEIVLAWPPFDRAGFRATAAQCAAATAQDGFTAAAIDVIWDNVEFHGGRKNMNIWDYSVCAGYGGEAGLRELVEAARQRRLKIIAWAPAGHLAVASPIWTAHPDWVLRNDRGEPAPNPSGLLQGDLSTGFAGYYRDRLAAAVRQFGLDGLWMDSHLAYAQQRRPPDHAARLLGIYRDLIRAGARHFIVEGDASAVGDFGIAIDDDWEREWGAIPSPDLYYGSSLRAGSLDPRVYLRHFREYAASGAPWIVDWDFLHSPKLSGSDVEAARAEIRRVLADYRRVKDRMTHRFVHADGSGYTWTNDRDGSRVIWLLKDAPLPDGRPGRAGQVYELPARR